MGKVWMPVEDGAITSFIRIENNGQWIKVYPPSNFNDYPEIARLPDDLRLCRLTNDAAVDMPRYSHRNGETEPPTMKGYYWVKGFATINGVIMRLSLMLTVADWHNSAMYAKLPDGGLVTVRGTSTGFASAEWNCEWWGPVMPPWEANNE